MRIKGTLVRCQHEMARGMFVTQAIIKYELPNDGQPGIHYDEILCMWRSPEQYIRFLPNTPYMFDGQKQIIGGQPTFIEPDVHEAESAFTMNDPRLAQAPEPPAPAPPVTYLAPVSQFTGFGQNPQIAQTPQTPQAIPVVAPVAAPFAPAAYTAPVPDPALAPLKPYSPINEHVYAIQNSNNTHDDTDHAYHNEYDAAYDDVYAEPEQNYYADEAEGYDDQQQTHSQAVGEDYDEREDKESKVARLKAATADSLQRLQAMPMFNTRKKLVIVGAAVAFCLVTTGVLAMVGGGDDTKNVAVRTNLPDDSSVSAAASSFNSTGTSVDPSTLPPAKVSTDAEKAAAAEAAKAAAALALDVKNGCVVQSVPYPSSVVVDTKMPAGTSAITTPGANGQQKTCYPDGTTKPSVTTILVAAVTQVTTIGNYVAPPAPAPTPAPPTPPATPPTPTPTPAPAP